MNIQQRGALFPKYVGLHLKGALTTRGFNAKEVANGTDHSPSAFNRWLNGKTELPMSVFLEVCEYIDIEPTKIIEDAYAQMCVDHGERDGYIYPPDEDDGNVTPLHPVGGQGEDDLFTAPLHPDRAAANTEDGPSEPDRTD